MGKAPPNTPNLAAANSTRILVVRLRLLERREQARLEGAAIPLRRQAVDGALLLPGDDALDDLARAPDLCKWSIDATGLC